MKKVLSFVLVLSLVLSSFSMAFATDSNVVKLTDIAGAANEDAIQVCNTLGIVTGYTDGTFKADKAVNRAEFAVMLTKALAVPESALAGYTATSFKDVAGYEWAVPYLAFCESKGIMSGYGDGIVKPGNTITVNEAMAMALRAAGYTPNSAVLVGTWPSNYVTLAQDLGLYDNVGAAATVDRGNAAQVIYNVLDVEKVQVNADGETNPVLDSLRNPVTMLTSGLGCEYVNGGDPFVLTKNDATVINTNEYIGAYVTAYHIDGEIVAIAEVNSVYLTGAADVSEDEFTVGDTTYTLDMDALSWTDADKNTCNTISFANGKTPVTPATTTAIGLDGTYTLAAKVSGKTIKEVYSVNTWTSEAPFLYEAGMVDEDSLNGYNFTLDDNDAIDKDTFGLFGVASLEKIPADAVVRVYLDTAGNSTTDIVRVEVSTKTVEGKVTLVNAADSEVTINGTVYTYASDVDNTPALGETGVASLDYNGDITFWDVTDATAENYAMVTGTIQTVGRDNTIVLFDKTGAEKEYVIKSDATITSASGLGLDELVTFAVNKDGKITEINEVTLNSSVGELSASREVYNNEVVADNVVVFAKNASADYSIANIKDIATKKSLTGTNVAYVTGGSQIAVMVVDPDYTGDNSVFAVLNKAANTFNAADEEVQVVEGFAAGKEYKAYTDERGVVGSDVCTTAGIVIAKLSVDANGVIVKAAATTGEIAVLSGYVVEKDGSNLLYVGTTSAAGVTWAAIDANAVVYTWDAVDGYGEAKLTDVKAKTATTTGSSIQLYQLDEDSEVYDLVIIRK